MSIYAIADLHLSFNENKPMNIFGEKWQNHEEKIQKELQNHLDVTDGMQEKEYPVTASVGMAVKEITKDFAIEDLIKTADRLMYQNKKENKRSGADYGRKKTNTKKGNMSI